MHLLGRSVAPLLFAWMLAACSSGAGATTSSSGTGGSSTGGHSSGSSGGTSQGGTSASASTGSSGGTKGASSAGGGTTGGTLGTGSTGAPGTTSNGGAPDGGTLCGQVSDGLVHPAPEYDTFAPGAVGTTYLDPQYGCPVTRISDGDDYCNSASTHQYSTISALSADDQLEIASLAWQCNPPQAGYILGVDGTVVVSDTVFPQNNNTANIPWDNFDPNRFYYTAGTTLYAAEVDRDAGSLATTSLCSFPSYGEVDIPDEEDISYDDDHLWLVGDPESDAGTAFLVTLTPTSPAAHTGCSVGVSVPIGAKETTWHKIQIAASNELAILMLTSDTTDLYDTTGTMVFSTPNTDHMDFGFDMDGTTEIAISPFFGGTSQNGCPSEWGWGVMDLSTGTVVRCLLDQGYDDASHVSYRDSPPRGPGWALFSLDRGDSCSDGGYGSDMSCFGGDDNWDPYSGEQVLVRVDGSQILRLAHHRSRTSVSYWPQSRGSISKDGKALVFDSNFNDFNDGTATVSGLDYVDSYFIRFGQ